MKFTKIESVTTKLKPSKYKNWKFWWIGRDKRVINEFWRIERDEAKDQIEINLFETAVTLDRLGVQLIESDPYILGALLYMALAVLEWISDRIELKLCW